MVTANTRWLERIPSVLRWSLVWAPIPFSVACLVMPHVHLDGYLWGTGEDGPLEWATVVLYLTAVVFALAVARRLSARHDHFGAAVYIVLAAGFVFIAGEEISWGQRILGFGGPEALVERNLQGEANLHNLLGRMGLHGLYILVGLWGVGLGRAVTARVRWLQPAILYAPGRPLFWWFLPVLAYYVYVDYVGPVLRLVVPGLAGLGEGPPRFQEPMELLLAGGFLLFVIGVWHAISVTVPQESTSPPAASSTSASAW